MLQFSQDVAGLDSRRLTVIPNGIDPQRFEQALAVPRKDLGIPEDAHLALAVGRLDPQKGIPDLLAAAERVIPQDPAWHLALAGDGPCRSWLLDQLAARPVLDGRIHWLGTRDDVPGLLRSANLLVLASLWEGMPNVVLEAMAAGRPVVATAVEGTEELVLPGQTGWLVPPGDPQSLGAALLDAARDPELCRRLGEQRTHPDRARILTRPDRGLLRTALVGPSRLRIGFDARLIHAIMDQCVRSPSLSVGFGCYWLPIVRAWAR